MSDALQKEPHSLSLKNREMLELGGIKAVDAFNEEEINASSDYGELVIKGEGLHIEVLELETGTLKVTGKVGAIVYRDRIVEKGWLRRAFSP